MQMKAILDWFKEYPFVAAFVGGFIAIVGIYLAGRRVDRKHVLLGSELLEGCLLNPRFKMGHDDIELRYRGDTVKGLWTYEIALRNVGNRALRAVDITLPLTIQVAEAVRLMNVKSSSSFDFDEACISRTDNQIVVAIELLQPAEWVKLLILQDSRQPPSAKFRAADFRVTPGDVATSQGVLRNSLLLLGVAIVYCLVVQRPPPSAPSVSGEVLTLSILWPFAALLGFFAMCAALFAGIELLRPKLRQWRERS